jgi:hypothetical protein
MTLVRQYRSFDRTGGVVLSSSCPYRALRTDRHAVAICRLALRQAVLTSLTPMRQGSIRD